MSMMIEVWYRKPQDVEREHAIRTCVSDFGGELTCREDEGENSICLTIEFPDWNSAQKASANLRHLVEHVEGPIDYGG